MSELRQVLTQVGFAGRGSAATRRRIQALALVSVLVPLQAEAIELSGRVVDSSGVPIAGSKVELQHVLSVYESSLEILAGKASWDAVAGVRTSRECEYLLPVPGPGMWRLEVSAAGRVPLHLRLQPLLEVRTLPDAVLESDAGLEVWGGGSSRRTTPPLDLKLTGAGRVR